MRATTATHAGCNTTCEDREHKMGDHESARLINEEVSKLWKVPTPEDSTSDPFMPVYLAVTFNHLEPRNS